MALELVLGRKVHAFSMCTTIVILGMLYLCDTEGWLVASQETGARVLEMRNVRSKQQCRQNCKAASFTDGVLCNWSTMYGNRCLLLHCPSLHLCLQMKHSDIAELLTGFKTFAKRKKRNGHTKLYPKLRREADDHLTDGTNGTRTLETMQTTFTRAILATPAILQPMEIIPTTNQPTGTPSSNSSQSTTLKPTKPTQSTAPSSTTLWPKVLLSTQMHVSTTQTTVVTNKITAPFVQPPMQQIEKSVVTLPAVTIAHVTSPPSETILVITSTAKQETSKNRETNVSITESTSSTLKSTMETTQTNLTITQSLQSTKTQAAVNATQTALSSNPTTLPVISTLEQVHNSTVNISGFTLAPNYATNLNTGVPQPEATERSPSQVSTNGTENTHLISATGKAFITVNIEHATTAEHTFFGTHSTITSIATPKIVSTPTYFQTTMPKLGVPAKPEESNSPPAPTKETTLSKTTAPGVQVTQSSGSTTSSKRATGDSQNDVNDGKYLVATWPLARHVMNTSSLLAVLLLGIIFFLAIVFVFAAQAYESYKKKDYTQVDYLINGMYTDSEL